MWNQRCQPFAWVKPTDGLGLLAWIYIAASVFIVCAEIDAVLVQRLYPRSLFSIYPATGRQPQPSAAPTPPTSGPKRQKS